MARKSRYLAYAEAIGKLKKEAGANDRTGKASGDNRQAGGRGTGGIQKR
ncbi:hypothetical protein [Pseudobutyrivibrio sp.]|nr:hypothetical protein [Pseudobutyrivibrio sp.]